MRKLVRFLGDHNADMRSDNLPKFKDFVSCELGACCKGVYLDVI